MINEYGLDFELEQHNAALESLMAELDAAEESMSSNSVVDRMLEVVEKNVDAQCTSLEACESMLSGIANEERKFNESITTLRDAACQLKFDGDKDAFRYATESALASLKATCEAANLKAFEAGTGVEDGDLQMLHDYLVGVRGIIDAKVDSFTGATESYCDFMEDLDMYNMELDTIEPATEAAAVGVSIAYIASLVALIAVADKAGNPEAAKYLKVVQKDYAPALKTLRKELKGAKKKNSYDEGITICKKIIDINNKLIKVAKSTAQIVKSSVVKKYSNGAESRKQQEVYSLKASSIIEAAEQENARMQAQIKLFERDKNNKKGALESSEAFMAGYAAAVEAMMTDDDDHTSGSSFLSMIND